MAIAYPFSAIVGQQDMKLALLIAAVDQDVGGVLVFGDRGTGKSTAIRALAALPRVTPMVGDGRQVFNPIHAEDLAKVVAECLLSPPGPGVWDIGGPTRITQGQLLRDLRGWLGLPPARPRPRPWRRSSSAR
jgi:uncharacterized protein YbjT (DUF2867 family)